MNLAYVLCLLAGLSALPGSVGRGEAAAYIGSAACGKCHPAEYAGQSQSGHAWALRRATDHPLAKYYTSAGNWRRDPSFLFEFSRKSDQFIVQAFDFATRQSLGLPVEWAFGAGRHAVTFVSRASGDVYIEYAFSFYPDSKTMDLTPGHRLMQADSLPKAMGVLHKIADPQNLQGGGIEKCFGCHSTGPVERTADGLKPSEPGVRCEVCHGPGRAHIKAVMEGRLELARGTIQNPHRMSAEKINEFCGSCHRFPGPDFAVNWNAVWNVRHQPPYLRQSRCFLESRGQLSCFTCHSPHAPLRTGDARFYAEKCMGCHAKTAKPPAAICLHETAGDCVHCHMPTVAVTSHLQFVNHWIGIYGNGNKLKPQTKARAIAAVQQ